MIIYMNICRHWMRWMTQRQTHFQSFPRRPSRLFCNASHGGLVRRTDLRKIWAVALLGRNSTKILAVLETYPLVICYIAVENHTF